MFRLLFCILLYSSTLNLFGQNENLIEDDSTENVNSDFNFKRYKWDVATSIPALLSNIVPLFYNPNYNGGSSFYLNPYVIQIRKNVLEDVSGKFSKRRAAYRIRIGFDVNGRISSKIDTQSLNLVSQNNSYSLNQNKSEVELKLNVGKEWQKQMGRFQLYYGLDLATSLYYNVKNITEFNYNNSNEIIKINYEAREMTSMLGISPFLGIKFFISSRICISAESAFNVFYVKNKTRSISNNFLLIRTEEFVRANLSPLSFFSLNYYFN